MTSRATTTMSSRIYDAWIDGLTDGKSGSQVGYDQAPFAEKTIVHGGTQSMPLKYDNTAKSFSEAVRTFDPAQNWTASGVKSLSLFFQGCCRQRRATVPEDQQHQGGLQRQRGRPRESRLDGLEHRSVHRRRGPEQRDFADDRHRGFRQQGHRLHRRYPALPADPRVHHAGRSGQDESGGALYPGRQRQ